LGFLLAWLLSSFKTSLFFIVNVIDVNDNVFNTADSNDGDDDDKKSVNDQADTVNAVDRDDSNTGDITTSDVAFFSNLRKRLTILFFRRSVEHHFVGACHGVTKE
jgi:hypothetical protein